MSDTGGLAAYLSTATLTRTATETAGPALLVMGIAVLGSNSDGPYLVAALTGVAALAGPLVGALLDRTRHPVRGFALSTLVLAIGLTCITLLLGTAPLWLLLAIAGIAGLGFPGITGAWTAQLPHIVPAPQLPRAYSADAGTYSLAAIIGPPVAAALIAVSGQAPLWFVVALLGLSLIALRFVHIAPRNRVIEHSLGDDLRHGARTIMRRRSLRQAVIITTVSFLGQAALFVTAPLIVKDLTGSLALTGVLFGAIAAGGFIAALFTMRFPITRPDRVIIWTTAVNAVCVLIAGLVPNIAVVLAAAFLLGLTEVPMLSSTFQIRTRETTPRVRAQVFTTAASLRTTAFAIGSAVFGAMLELGVTAVILAGVCCYVVSLVWGLAVGPRVHHHRRARGATNTVDA